MPKSIIIFITAILLPFSAFAELKDIDQVMSHAAKQGADLTQLLKDIQLQPVGESPQGQLMKVTRVEPGSVYEKMGIKTGDVVISKKGSSRVQGKNLELRSAAMKSNSRRANHQGPGYSTVSFTGQPVRDRDLQLYKDFSLQPGDKIVMFNGRPISSPQDAMDLYDLIKRNRVSQLLIQRNDRFKLLSETK